MEPNNPAPTPGANDPPADPPKTFTQAEMDAIIGERLDRERKKYADYSDLKKAAEKLAEIEKGQMTELERMKAELAERDKLLQERDQELTGLKLERIKRDKLAEAKIDPVWADSVTGSTEDEITASVARISQRLQGQTPTAAQGAGHVSVQNPASPKIWTQSEIRELRLSGKLTDEVMAEIKQATAEGRVQ